MRKEKVIVSVNKSKEEDCFQEACPNLFGADFARRSKEFLDQLMAIRTTIPAKSQESTRKPFFRRAPLNEGGLQVSKGQSLKLIQGPGPAKVRSEALTHVTSLVSPVTIVHTHAPVSSQLKTHVQSVQNVIASMGNCPTGDKRSSSRTAALLHKELGEANKGTVGLRHSKGLQYRVFVNSQATTKTACSTVQSGPDTLDNGRSQSTSEERSCDGTSSSSGGRILLHPISGAKEGWRSETSHQPESAKQLRKSATLQDGGHTHIENPPTTGGLVSKSRSKGCLLLHPHSPRPQEISVFPSGEHDLPVHLSLLRPRFSPMGLYQDPQAYCSSRTGAGITGSFFT